jgi:hypothetical protein
MNKTYIIATVALIFSLLGLMFYLQPTITPISDWYDNNWKYRIKLDFDYTKIDVNQTDFPTLIYLNSSRINWKAIQDDLSDLRFIKNNQSLAYEIESYTINSEAWIWVKTNTSYSFYMYYGNPIATSNENKTTVWENGNVMTQHMKDETTSTILDSTTNNNDGTKIAINEPIETTGKIGKAQSFDGINDYINALHSVPLSIPYNFTVSMQVKYITKTGGAFIAKRGGISDTINYAISPTGATGYFRFEIYDGANNPSATASNKDYADGAFHHVVCTRNIIDDNLKIYVDGVLKNTGTDTTVLPITNIADLNIGKVFTYYVNSILDEIRIYNQTKTESWIKTDFYSQSDLLLTYGSEEYYG